MKYAMKMVLIPEAEYRKLLPEGGIKAKISKIVSLLRNCHNCLAATYEPRNHSHRYNRQNLQTSYSS